MRKWLERLWASAIDTAFQTLWLGVGSLVVAVALVIWAGVAGLSASALDRLIGCFVGIAIVVGATVLLTGIRLRRSRAQERLRQSIHTSKEKGFLDFAVQRDEAGAQFHKAVTVLSSEWGRLTRQAYSTRAKFDAVAAAGGRSAPRRARKIAAAMAKALHKNCVTLERKIADADSAMDLFMESQIGYLNWQLPSLGADLAGAAKMRAESAELIAVAKGVITDQPEFKKVLDSLRGVSQELNTAINRLAAASDGMIGIMQKLGKIGDETARLLDGVSAAAATCKPH